MIVQSKTTLCHDCPAVRVPHLLSEFSVGSEGLICAELHPGRSLIWSVCSDSDMSANRRITLIFGGFVAAVAAAFYPIFFHPLTHTDEYSK